jgi:hypothetical protein
LSNSEIFFNFFMKSWLLLLCKLRRSMHDIFISNLNDVLFIFIDNTKELSLNSQEMLTCFILA